MQTLDSQIAATLPIASVALSAGASRPPHPASLLQLHFLAFPEGVGPCSSAES